MPRLSAACAADLDLPSTIEALSSSMVIPCASAIFCCAVQRSRRDPLPPGYCGRPGEPARAAGGCRTCCRACSRWMASSIARPDQSPLHEVYGASGSRSLCECIQGLNRRVRGIDPQVQARAAPAARSGRRIAADDAFSTWPRTAHMITRCAGSPALPSESTWMNSFAR